jgi:hypothetical protein
VAGTINARGSPSFSHFRRVRCTPGGKGRVLLVLLAVVVADIGKEGQEAEVEMTCVWLTWWVWGLLRPPPCWLV